jgi:hypothetical protein
MTDQPQKREESDDLTETVTEELAKQEAKTALDSVAPGLGVVVDVGDLIQAWREGEEQDVSHQTHIQMIQQQPQQKPPIAAKKPMRRGMRKH